MNRLDDAVRKYLDGRNRNRDVLDECRPGDMVTLTALGATWSITGRFVGRTGPDMFRVDVINDSGHFKFFYNLGDLKSGSLRRFRLPRVRAWRSAVEPEVETTATTPLHGD